MCIRNVECLLLKRFEKGMRIAWFMTKFLIRVKFAITKSAIYCADHLVTLLQVFHND